MSLLQNGSFELGPNPGDYLRFGPGSKDISGWDVIGGGVDYYGTGWVASDGNRSLDLNGTPGIGGVAQTFATTPGEKYHVSFDLAGHNSGLLQTMRVSAAEESADFSFQSGTDPNHLGWQGKTWDFTATAPQTTLNFESLTGYEYGGPALDNVVVTPGDGPPEANAATGGGDTAEAATRIANAEIDAAARVADAEFAADISSGGPAEAADGPPEAKAATGGGGSEEPAEKEANMTVDQEFAAGVADAEFAALIFMPSPASAMSTVNQATIDLGDDDPGDDDPGNDDPGNDEAAEEPSAEMPVAEPDMLLM